MKDSDDTVVKRLGNRMKEIRKERGMTQLDVAIKSGMEENAYQRIESGRTNPSVKTVNKIADALEVEIKILFEF